MALATVAAAAACGPDSNPQQVRTAPTTTCVYNPHDLLPAASSQCPSLPTMPGGSAAALPMSGGEAPAATSATRPLAGGWCRGTQLAARYGGRVSPMTGEHAALVTVWNVSRNRCRLPDYPTVALFAARDRLPFRFQRGGAYIQGRPRRSVVVAPGATAHFLVAKYRCDVESLTRATAVVIEAAPTAIRATLPAGGAGPTIDDCGPASSDPGNTVEVGPYEPGPAQGF